MNSLSCLGLAWCRLDCRPSRVPAGRRRWPSTWCPWWVWWSTPPPWAWATCGWSTSPLELSGKNTRVSFFSVCGPNQNVLVKSVSYPVTHFSRIRLLFPSSSLSPLPSGGHHSRSHAFQKTKTFQNKMTQTQNQLWKKQTAATVCLEKVWKWIKGFLSPTFIGIGWIRFFWNLDDHVREMWLRQEVPTPSRLVGRC